MSLEDYKVTEDAEEGHDLLVKVKLKQWRDYGTKTVDVGFASSRASVGGQRETSGSPAPSSAQSYTVVGLSVEYRKEVLWQWRKIYCHLQCE